MRTPIRLFFIAGLSLAGIETAAADCDVSVWRWHVNNVLHAQQSGVNQPPSVTEVRANAFEATSRFARCSDNDIDDGSFAPAEDLAHRLRKSGD